MPEDRPLERELQIHLSKNLQLLGVDGARLVRMEYPVSFGRIDILAQVENGAFLVIEVKRDQATREHVGQLLAYVGALQIQYPGRRIMGFLVAPKIAVDAKFALRAATDLYFCSLSPELPQEERLRCRNCSLVVAVRRMNSMVVFCQNCHNLI